MADGTKIEWTDASWNPVRGCTRVSEGCRHCYAEAVAARFSGEGQPYEGLATQTQAGPRWTGKLMFVERHLEDPLRWRKPRTVFVNSMSDLFHEDMPDEWIERIFRVMATAREHTYQILTKRPKRMRDFMRLHRTWSILPHIWLGVSAEDQKTWNDRVDTLLETPAAHHFVSIEPLLDWIDPYGVEYLDWGIVGGESGDGARHCAISWIRHIVVAFLRHEKPIFVKQLGARPSIESVIFHEMARNGRAPLLRPGCPAGFEGIAIRHHKGADMEEWPIDLRVRDVPAWR